MSGTRPNLVGVSIYGGLGNQMFQYAAGLALSERLGAELSVDIRHYERKDRGDRRLGLRDFGIELQSTRVPPFKIGRRVASALRLLPNPFRGGTSLVSVEGFDPQFHQLSAPAALSGHFQSWRYLAGHEASVRRVFDVGRLATPRTASLAADIAKARNPVAVHIRRGDYTISPESIAFFGLLHADYYRAAKTELEAKVEDPTYFLFSDQVDVALTELAGWQGLRPVTGFSAYEDMYLMSSCKHFIIANSTFSWWAAWLGAAPDKVVAGPKQWFGPAYPYPVDPSDRSPPGWLLV